MQMLINFVNMFRTVYKGFICELKFGQSAFINMRFCMQKNKWKPSSVFVFPSGPKRMSVRFIENRSQLEHFYFKTSQTGSKTLICIQIGT